MKKLLFTLLGAAAIMVAGCEKRGPNPSVPIPLSGDWKVIYYSAGENVMTGNYNAYTFDFKPQEAITARTGDKEANGYWAMSTDPVRTFDIAFNSGDATLSALNNHWEVLTVNSTEVRLADTETGEQIYFARQ